MNDTAIEAARRAWAARYPHFVADQFQQSLSEGGVADGFVHAASAALTLLRERPIPTYRPDLIVRRASELRSEHYKEVHSLQPWEDHTDAQKVGWIVLAWKEREQ